MLDNYGGCKPHHDSFTLILSSGLIIGLILSYLPQHLRIINAKSSEGLSPWYLLLGSTSSAAGFLNVVTLQWGVIKCCKELSKGACIESVLGVVQVFFQWFMFSAIFVLYLIYFPSHLKYVTVKPLPHPGHPARCDCETCELARKGEYEESTSEWKMSVVLACVVAAHFLISLFTTFFIVLYDNRPLGDHTTPPDPRVGLWATFLGLSSTILCAIQYTPQLYRTWHAKTVGSLSILMMCIQTPGAVLMVLSIALREGTDWTSWAMFAMAGFMQGLLLIMCLAWKRRQARLGIDDYGRPLEGERAPLLPGQQ
ncbi:PQ-loop repeat-containing protein 1 [Ceratobasidium sp. AG-Ba]|nr:PQ-loop repeat-containing protein 1 [Ceratobasidium sp. AG-Ba]QRV98579.1 PQ-loop repeat-containing protein 1 [Ceratobasidium sp. AG-Ba]